MLRLFSDRKAMQPHVELVDTQILAGTGWKWCKQQQAHARHGVKAKAVADSWSRGPDFWYRHQNHCQCQRPGVSNEHSLRSTPATVASTR